MKRISIIKNGQITNQAQFANDELLNEWLNRETLNLSFGYPERDLIDTPSNPVSEELKARAISSSVVINELGEERTIYKIPADFTVEIEDITSITQAEANKKAKLEAGKKAREACIRCLDIIAGHNLEQALTAAQITEMQSSFAPIQSALMTSRPTTAKALISALVPDEVLVSQELKDLILAELSAF